MVEEIFERLDEKGYDAATQARVDLLLKSIDDNAHKELRVYTALTQAGVDSDEASEMVEECI